MHDPRFPPPPGEPFVKAPEPTPPGVWRDGRLLVMQKGAFLPARCIHCNEPASTDRPICKTYYWHPQVYGLLILLGALPYLIVAYFVREQGTVCMGLCERHRRRRRNSMLIGWFGTLGGLAGAISAGLFLKNQAAAYAAMAAAGVFLVCLIWGAVGSKLLAPKRIDAHIMQLNGCGDRFLASLPQFTPFAGFMPPVHYGPVPTPYAPPPYPPSGFAPPPAPPKWPDDR